MEPGTRPIDSHGLPRVFWIYLAGAALVAAGFADYPLIAFLFQQAGTVPGDWVAIFYSIAMAVSGTGSLVLGRLFDRWGFRVLIVLTIVGAGFAPLVFLGGFWTALVGAAIWGLGMGVHESIIPAAVSPMVPVERRAFAFGVFTAGYGVAWFAGSAMIGVLYDVSLNATSHFAWLRCWPRADLGNNQPAPAPRQHVTPAVCLAQQNGRIPAAPIVRVQNARTRLSAFEITAACEIGDLAYEARH